MKGTMMVKTKAREIAPHVSRAVKLVTGVSILNGVPCILPHVFQPSGHGVTKFTKREPLYVPSAV
jgi:hypothetical protein